MDRRLPLVDGEGLDDSTEGNAGPREADGEGVREEASEANEVIETHRPKRQIPKGKADRVSIVMDIVRGRGT